MRKPDFFIVGAPKCGTTAMNSYLKQHPEIFIPDKKELHFFGRDLSKKYRITEKEYLSYFSKAQNRKRAGESSVWYLCSARAAGEIKNFCPFASIIIMLRNPVDMMYALHSEQIFRGRENIKDFEAALEAEEDRKQGYRISDSKGDYVLQGLFYREAVRYTEQVKRYMDVFGHKNIHIIIFDDFKEDTTKVYRETLRFLGVNEEFGDIDFKTINSNKRIRSKSLRRYLQNPPSLAQRFAKLLIPTLVRQRILNGLMSLNTSHVQRSPMDANLRKHLQLEFMPEVKKLSELVGRDLTHWSRN
jgi:hypothetical protein